MDTAAIEMQTRLIQEQTDILQRSLRTMKHDAATMEEKIKENKEKIKMNKQLPYLVGNIVELLDIEPEDSSESGGADHVPSEGANVDLDSQRKGKCAVIKTSTR